MSRVCEVTGKKPIVGHRVSHSNRKTKVRLLPNLQSKRFWLEDENRWVKLKVSVKGIREIDKRGIRAVLKDMASRGIKK